MDKMNKRFSDLITTSDAPHERPVTISGWYGRTDGAVTHYRWDEGSLVEGVTVRDWASVSRYERLVEADWPQFCACCHISVVDSRDWPNGCGGYICSQCATAHAAHAD